MMDRLPLRLRLTFWYSLVFATALLCLGVVCLWMVHRAVDDLEKNELQQRVRSVRRFLEGRPKQETSAQLREAMTADYDVSHGNKWLQIIDERGNWLYRAPHVAEIYPYLVLPWKAPTEGTYFTYRNGELDVRAFIQPITVRGVRYTVQTGLTLNKTLAILSSFRYQLMLLTGLGLLVSSIAGYFMSSKALSPIAAIASEAQRINDKNLNTRLRELKTRDELAALSSTLNQMLTRIDSGYQSVRTFTANAAHELRSPVALLRAETEVALAFPRDAAYYRNTCERVLDHSMQMSHLIDQLLTLARADAGVEVLVLEPCNLPDVLKTAGAEWYRRFEQAGIRFHVDCCMAEFWIEADYLALNRLINILLENAWRYTPSDKTVSLALSAHSQEAEGSFATIAVRDTGIGIATKVQAKVFERFYRAGHPVRGNFPGSGLGLVLAQWIAEHHGSRIELESTLSLGSCFSLQFVKIETPSPRPTSSTLIQAETLFSPGI